MFDLMYIAEYIYKGIVELSYKKHTRAYVAILIFRRKRHLGVKYVVTNLMRLGWQTLFLRQDAKLAKHRRGLSSMMPNRRSTDREINTPSQKEKNHIIGMSFGRMQGCRLHDAGISRQLTFCVVVGQIGYSWLPVDAELVAAGAVVDQVEVHVGGF